MCRCNILIFLALTFFTGCNGDDIIDCKNFCNKQAECLDEGGDDVQTCIMGCEFSKDTVQAAYLEALDACMQLPCDEVAGCSIHAYDHCVTPDNSEAYAEAYCAKMVECGDYESTLEICVREMTAMSVQSCLKASLFDSQMKCVEKANCDNYRECAVIMWGL